MPEAIETQIAELARLSGAMLRQRFEEAFGKAPGLRTSAELLRLALAYRVQEEAGSGLVPRTRSLLTRLESRLKEGKPVVSNPTIRLKPGTRLVRMWKGERHQVTVLEQGFDYLGRRYSTLSAIAREIAGSPWSGPAFFGLKEKRRREATDG
jgi:hypothetical protein